MQTSALCIVIFLLHPLKTVFSLRCMRCQLDCTQEEETQCGKSVTHCFILSLKSAPGIEQKIKGCGNEKLSEQFSTSDICYITNRDLSEDSVCYKCRHDLCNDIDTTPSPNPVLRKCMEQVCNDDDDCEPQKSRTCDLGVSACISLRNKAGVIKKSCYATPLVNNQKVYTQLPTVKECDDLHQYYKKDNSVFCDICYSDNCNFDTTALREAEIRDKEEIKKPSRKCYSCIGKDCDKNKYIRDVCHKNTSECYTIKGMGIHEKGCNLHPNSGVVLNESDCIKNRDNGYQCAICIEDYCNSALENNMISWIFVFFIHYLVGHLY